MKKQKKTILAILLVLAMGLLPQCAMQQVSKMNSSSYRTALEFAPRYSFVRIDKIIELEICIDEDGIPLKKCELGRAGGYGSGTIVAKDLGDGYILTANHVCTIPIPPLPDGIEIIKSYIQVVDLDTKEHMAEIVALDPINDICILKAKDIKYDALRMSSTRPKPGERLINIAAPGAFFAKGTVPMYDVIYIGEYEAKKSEKSKESTVYGLYTTHAYPGSSGSMIINYRGEIVGILDAVIRGMETIAISPEFNILKSFVEKSLKQNCPKCKI